MIFNSIFKDFKNLYNNEVTMSLTGMAMLTMSTAPLFIPVSMPILIGSLFMGSFGVASMYHAASASKANYASHSDSDNSHELYPFELNLLQNVVDDNSTEIDNSSVSLMALISSVDSDYQA